MTGTVWKRIQWIFILGVAVILAGGGCAASFKATSLKENYQLPPDKLAEILEHHLNDRQYTFTKKALESGETVYEIETTGDLAGNSVGWAGVASNTDITLTLSGKNGNRSFISMTAEKSNPMIEGEPYLEAKALLEDLRVRVKEEYGNGTVVAQAPAPSNGGKMKIKISFPPFDFQTEDDHVLLSGSIEANAEIKDMQILLNGEKLPQTRDLSIVQGTKGSAFSRNVELKEGKNIIVINAVDESGQVKQHVMHVTRTAPGQAPAELSADFKGQRWAVVVGVSRYEHSQKGIPNLRYADADARLFYEFLKSPQGGGFTDDHIIFLENENATLAELKRSLFDFLGKAIREDLVVVYFAGHGAPDPLNPSNLFLLTHDTDPEQMRSTAFPMWDLQTALERFIPSERVVVLVDACHSAGVGDEITTRNIGDENVINRYLLELSKAGKGRAIFTASESGELSHESPEWGGGHGAFTWFMLEGLKGPADTDSDSIVSLGEMIDYTSEQVRRATKSGQHPDTSGRFDRNLPMAVLTTSGS